MLYSRHITGAVGEALEDTPVVLITGARQCGKTTLARQLASEGAATPWAYATLDDPATLSAASASPASFIEDLGPKAVIDEIQRVPELFLTLKRQVDRERTPGRYLLTGSANVFMLPRLSDSLAGRMEALPLWPLSQGERENRREGFVDGCFQVRFPESGDPLEWPALLDRIVQGGYPEPMQRPSPSRKQAWWTAYLASILERDVRDLANIEGLREMPRLLEVLAARTGGLLNFSEMARTAGIPTSSLKRYVGLFRALYLHIELPAWFRNLEKRLIKAPKSYINDTGLLCHLRGVDARALGADRNRAGPVLENFVIMEIIKQIGWSECKPRPFHFRDVSGAEVDLVLETRDGKLVGIEIKSSSHVDSSYFRGLRTLARLAGPDFIRGIVLYSGTERLAFEDRLLALPISSIWRTPPVF